MPQPENEPKQRTGFLQRIGQHMEVFVAVAALITAVAAVVMTLEQTELMQEEAELERKNARISVLPSVWVATHIGDTEDSAYFKVVLDNRGLGPAVMERFDVTYDGEPVYNWDDLARRIAADIDFENDFVGGTVGSWRSPVSPGLMLQADGRVEPLEINHETDMDALRLFMRGSLKLGIKACYCSLYDECFETELFQRPQPVAACAAAEKPFISHGFFRN